MSLQNWEEHEPNQEAFLRSLHYRWRDSNTEPFAQARKWRRRFYAALLLDLVLLLWLLHR